MQCIILTRNTGTEIALQFPVSQLSRRAYFQKSTASLWEEIWEAGPYYNRISERLEVAQNYAVFVGWQIDSRLPMLRPSAKCAVLGRENLDNPSVKVPSIPSAFETLREKAIRLCEEKPGFQIYFLIWDHAWFYVAEREAWQGRVWETIHPRVHFLFDNRHPLGASHHEKICLIDGTEAFCGGIDLCGDRWDTPLHRYTDRRRSLDWKKERHGPYHDLAVRVMGQVCARLHGHVANRWRALCATPFPEPTELKPVPPGHSVYISRTLAPIDGKPIIREIEFLFRDLLLSAQNRIILEGQYYWSKRVNDLLIAKILEMYQTGRHDFELILILTDLDQITSLTRKMMNYQLRLLYRLKKTADLAGIRFIAGTPYVQPPASPPDQGKFRFFQKRARPVYIHSKTIVIDDRYLSIGSANFAARAFRLDTEVNLTLAAQSPAEREHIRQVGEWILSHWNINPRKDATIQLRPFPLPRKRTWVPWENFFDPETPWFYLMKSKILHRTRNKPALVPMLFLVPWLLGGVLIARLAHLPLTGPSPTGLYGLALSLIWLFPLPYMAILVLIAGTSEKIAVAREIGLFSLWIAATWSYLYSRIFPTSARYWYRRSHPRRLQRLIRSRDFPTLLGLLANPRVSIHSKIVLQGLYFIPFVWFLIAIGLVLPAMIDPILILSFQLGQWLGEGYLKPYLKASLPFLLLFLIERECIRRL